MLVYGRVCLLIGIPRMIIWFVCLSKGSIFRLDFGDTLLLIYDGLHLE